MLIDAHAHVMPGSFPAAPSGCDPASWPAMSAVAGEDSRLLTSGALRFTARTVWFDAEQRLAASAASGVDAEVVSPFPPLLNYALPVMAGRDLARWPARGERGGRDGADDVGVARGLASDQHAVTMTCRRPGAQPDFAVTPYADPLARRGGPDRGGESGRPGQRGGR